MSSLSPFLRRSVAHNQGVQETKKILGVQSYSRTPLTAARSNGLVYDVQVEEVTVFIHVLHMHENGKRFQTRQYRTDCSGNEELIYTADVEYYSFLQAGGFKVSNTGGVTIQVRVRGRGTVCSRCLFLAYCRRPFKRWIGPLAIMSTNNNNKVL